MKNSIYIVHEVDDVEQNRHLIEEFDANFDLTDIIALQLPSLVLPNVANFDQLKNIALGLDNFDLPTVMSFYYALPEFDIDILITWLTANLTEVQIAAICTEMCS